MHGPLAAHVSQPPVLHADWLLVEKKGEITFFVKILSVKYLVLTQQQQQQQQRFSTAE